MKWFVEEKNFKGQWSPAVYYSGAPPTERNASGRTRKFRTPPKEVSPEHMHLEFNELCEIYGEDKPDTRRLHLSYDGDTE